jgi:Putative prokaryotic signal transducing protein
MDISGPEKIITYTAFDNVIAANIAKTKLDAYDIPCFLTEENFTGLYPLKNDLFPGVRLHIFEHDAEQVKNILEEENP